jgi:hypothetical protein
MFYHAWTSLRVPFLRQLMFRLFPYFSLTQDNGSCSDHILDSQSIAYLKYLFLDLVSS